MATTFEHDAVRALVPPADTWSWVGEPARFVKVGRAMFDHMVEHARLTPTSRVLDIGCGIGKHAIHFAPFLRPPGAYEGFDVDARGIAYCSSTITPRYPHVRFRHVDIRSGMYRPDGGEAAGRFRFPYADRSFDFAFLASVFSHMFLGDVAHYVSEVARVLKPGGRVLATGYFIGERQRAGIDAGTAAFRFAIPHRGSLIERPEPPEAAVAQPRDAFLATFADAALEIVSVRDGLWPSQPMQDQDFVLAEKPAPA